jgi:hypothetical protein
MGDRGFVYGVYVEYGETERKRMPKFDTSFNFGANVRPKKKSPKGKKAKKGGRKGGGNSFGS